MASIEHYWAMDADELAAALSSTPGGLTAETAAERLPQTRARALPTDRRVGSWRLLARQFTSPIILILIGATVIAAALGDTVDAVIILTIVALSGLLDFAQERGAANAMTALLSTVRPDARVVRDGAALDIPADEVVAGDLVQVAAGDIVPADAVVLTADDLQLDQSSLTGETFPAEKRPGRVDDAAPLAERGDVIYLGTHVASGSGSALVVRTGRDTEFGHVAESMHERARRTGFEQGMTRFGLLLARVMAVIVVVIFIANLVLQRPLVDSALFSLSLAVGLTPQLLPAIIGISLARGAREIARHRVIVKRLNAIEDFGSMTVLCTDKTGTLTQGSIHLDAAVHVDDSPAPALLEIASWNARLQSGLANPLDAAIVVAADAAGIRSVATKVDEAPYDFDRKRLSVLVDTPAGGRMLVTKGAVDPVLAVCTTAVDAAGRDRPIAELRTAALDTVTRLSGQGMRVLAVATRPATEAACTAADEHDLRLVGFLAFADPVKADAADTVAQFATSGVRVRMITGDSRLAAMHIAAELGLDDSQVVAGSEIDGLDDQALADRVRTAQVFCETAPAHKARIVAAYARAGETVGYLGDGINDAPALRAADVGVSVKGAADVATEAAAIVMLENDLKALLGGMHEGRRTFANTTKYLFMTTSAGFGNMISMAIASLALPFLPLTAAQILLINLLSDLPATGIATDNVDPNRMRAPQRWNLRLLLRFMLVFGPVSSIFDILTFIVMIAVFGADETIFQSAWFVGSVLTAVAVIFVLRTRGPFFRSRPSTTLALLAALAATIAVALPYLPFAGLLHLQPLSLPMLGFLALIVVGYVATAEATKAVFWRRSRQADGGATRGSIPHTPGASTSAS
ncbi:MAG: magnesium-translocating P-type ATPase [Microbacterium sp.]|uniref:magnesium-translocating P-type ATPase n=1 Tax=Microbacterium sp. TaxID=51671 RepID=UPI001ACAB0DA|nr:magnesium-translocating P-type ATPase [Microbacterium sp.]MBN9176051.1 magnesium-translocating P-type ATPase [Microbacterium sp.]